MASAAPRLSPLTITVRTPRACSASMAARAPSLGASAKATRARACGTAASSAASQATETVAACACCAWAAASKGFKSTPSSRIQAQLPMRHSRPSTRPSVPRPGTARIEPPRSTASPVALPPEGAAPRLGSGPAAGSPPRSPASRGPLPPEGAASPWGGPAAKPVRPGAGRRLAAASTTARASGCSLPACTAATAASAASASVPGAGSKAVRRGRPSVSVPVLSKATVSTWWAISSASASLIRMPCFAATPVPAMMAVGVASPSAQGQAITSTATARMMAVSSPTPASHQPTKVSSAMPSTAGTNTALTWSTSRCTGALAACASSTSRMMCASTLSLPAAVTSISTRPSPLIEPPVSASPVPLATGSGSPVSMASSTCVLPSLTLPSAGTRSPGRTASLSPARSSSTGMSFSWPSQSIRCASSGRSACSARMAAVVWRLARASSHLPSSTSVTTTAELSKYRCAWAPWPENSHRYMDSAHAADVPTATSRSMLPVPAFSACQPAL